MSVALLPQFGTEMDDSVMQEDHPTDTVIAIDMESPKHHEATPQGMVFTDATPTTATWNAATFQQRSDHIVDVEFETEGGAFEEDGMMTGAEVEMTTAPTYGEEYEYEMTYDTGGVEQGYEVQDAEVLDAEVLDAAHSAEPHVEGGFVPFVHEISETVFAPSLIAESDALETSSHVPPTLDATETQVTENENETEPLTSNEQLNEGSAIPEAEPAHTAPPEEAPTAEPIHSTLEPPVTEERPALATEETATERAPLPSPSKSSTEHEANLETKESLPETSEVQVVAAEVVSEVAAVEPEETYEEGDYQVASIETRLSNPPPPILLSTYSDDTKISTTLAIFNDPDASAIPSTSTSESVSVLLDQHQNLFVEPISTFLTQLRVELLQSQPHVIPPTEFEFKELQLVVRDLQLILTEVGLFFYLLLLRY
jgi:hypothetical protein